MLLNRSGVEQSAMIGPAGGSRTAEQQSSRTAEQQIGTCFGALSDLLFCCSADLLIFAARRAAIMSGDE
jgi:hypothetical protein